MPRRVFHPGFRFSRLDGAILIGGACLAAGVGWVHGWIGVAIAYVVGHFFLFCNVLRMSRLPELVWAAVFVMLAAAAMAGEVVSWPTVFLASAGLTVVLAVNEMRRPCYHGVGWQRVNPRLREWWEAAA